MQSGEHCLELGDPLPVNRVFDTPRTEVDVTCRIALAHYLSVCGPGVAALGKELLWDGTPDADSFAANGDPVPVPADGAAGAQQSASRPRADHSKRDWEALHAILRDLTVLDPACGRGSFLLGMLELLDALGGQTALALDLDEDSLTRRRRIVERNLYGVEAQTRVLEEALCRLRRAAGRHASGLDLPLVWGDSLVGRPGPFRSSRIQDVLKEGGFDLVVGNPPYLRHEMIADPLGRLSRRGYKQAAQSTVHRRLPAFFRWNEGQRTAGRPLDRRSDLCVFFTFVGLSLLRPGGVLGFVLPTGLFGARYGRQLLEYLESTDGCGLILESTRRRSFAQAGVNTAILVFGGTGGRAGDSVRRIFLECALGEADLSGSLGAVTSPGPRRALPAARSATVHDLLETVDSLLTPLRSLGAVRYPIKTGVNRFFYPDAATIARFGIEPEYCRPVVRSPRDVRTIALDLGSVVSSVFVCPQSQAELAALGKSGALAYVRWGATQRTAAGVPWPSVPSVQGRTPWYRLDPPPPADVLCPRFFDRRFFFVVPAEPVLADQTFYGLHLSPDTCKIQDLAAAVLNCSLSYLLLELHGRTGLGEGVRQYGLCDMAALPVLDPRSISEQRAAPVLAAFARIARREMLPIEREVERADRAALDDAVAGALDISPRDMAAARDALLLLTRRRHERARHV